MMHGPLALTEKWPRSAPNKRLAALRCHTAAQWTSFGVTREHAGKQLAGFRLKKQQDALDLVVQLPRAGG